MEQVRLELCLEQEEEANRQKETVSTELKWDHIGHIPGSCGVTFVMAANVFHQKKKKKSTGGDGEEDQAEEDDGASLPGSHGF